MTHKKALFGLCILLMSMALFTVPGFAQDEGAGSEASLRGQFRECVEALRAMRQSGDQISRDNFPEACALRGERPYGQLFEGGGERGRQSAACLEAIQELQESGQRVTREEILELEECTSNLAGSVGRLSMYIEGEWFERLDEQLRQEREERALQREERALRRNEEWERLSAECREAIRELRDAGQQVTRDNLPAVCRARRRQDED